MTAVCRAEGLRCNSLQTRSAWLHTNTQTNQTVFIASAHSCQSCSVDLDLIPATNLRLCHRPEARLMCTFTIKYLHFRIVILLLRLLTSIRDYVCAAPFSSGFVFGQYFLRLNFSNVCFPLISVFLSFK